MKMFQFSTMGKSIMATGLVCVMGLSFGAANAVAEDAVPNGWVVSSPVVRAFSGTLPDGRGVIVNVSMGVQRERVVHGVIYHVYRGGRPPEHVAILAMDMREYDPNAYRMTSAVYVKSFWGSVTSLPGKVADFLRKARKFVSDIRDLTAQLKAFLVEVMALFDELGFSTATELQAANGNQAVVSYAKAVQAAAFDERLPELDQKAAMTLRATVFGGRTAAAQRSLAKALVTAILRQK